MKKLKFAKSNLKEWNKTVFGDLRERKSAIILEIERLSTFRTRREFKPRSICFEDSEKERVRGYSNKGRSAWETKLKD